jgi:hypothetical protein
VPVDLAERRTRNKGHRGTETQRKKDGSAPLCLCGPWLQLGYAAG